MSCCTSRSSWVDGLGMLYMASCKAGRDTELLKILDGSCSRLVTLFLQARFEGEVATGERRSMVACMRRDLRAFRRSGLIGPFAGSLLGSLLTAIQARSE